MLLIDKLYNNANNIAVLLSLREHQTTCSLSRIACIQDDKLYRGENGSGNKSIARARSTVYRISSRPETQLTTCDTLALSYEQQ